MSSHSKYDPDFTRSVVDAIGPAAKPRIRQLVSSLIQHTHDFIRENEVTKDEWSLGLEYLNKFGKMSDEKTNFTSLVFQLFGTESLLNEVAAKIGNDSNVEGTPSAALGPFFRDDVPLREKDSFIVTGVKDAEITYMHGVVFDQNTKKPIPGAWVDVWQASTNGLYEHQDENQVEYNLRGKFKTDENGSYSFYCIRPTAYPISIDGPAGELLKLLDRPAFRPAHIHLYVQRKGYKPLITQVYDSKGLYLKKDAIFSVKEKLIADFKPIEGNPKAKYELDFPIFLVPADLE